VCNLNHVLRSKPFFFKENCIGKHQALSREVTCDFRLYFEIDRTSVKPNLKHNMNMFTFIMPPDAGSGFQSFVGMLNLIFWGVSL